MANSLVKLTLESNQYEQGLRKAKKGFEDFTRSLGVNMKTLSTYAIAAGAVTTAMKVMKDAFMASEANIDAWGRTVEASKAAYEGFLTSINTGDISGFLGRIDQIKDAAMEAYNALDLLNTQKTIQSPQISAKQAEISRMRAILQSGRYIAPADGRTNGKKTGDQLSQAELKVVSQQLESAMNEIANITKSQVKSASDAIDKLYNEQALILGVSKKEFMDATSSWENFSKAMEKAAKYNEYEKSYNQPSFTNMYAQGVGAKSDVQTYSQNPYEAYAWLNVFKDDGERFKRLVEEIQKRDAASSQLYGQYGQIYRRINRVEGISPFGGRGGVSVTPFTAKDFSGMGFGITTSMDTLLAQQQFWKKALSGATNMFEAGDAQAMLDKLQKQIDAQPLALRFGLDTESAVSLKESMKGLPISDLQPLKDVSDKKKKTVSVDENAGIFGVGKMASGFENLVGSVEMLGIELPQGLKDIFGGIQAVTNVLTSIMTIVEAIEMISSATSFIPFFAKGGIIPHAARGLVIPGNDFSDRTPVFASAGELILNKAAQGNIASQLTDRETTPSGGSPYVTGEQIYIGLTNYLRRTGRGELQTLRR
jgi:hypothetical protein